MLTLVALFAGSAFAHEGHDHKGGKRPPRSRKVAREHGGMTAAVAAGLAYSKPLTAPPDAEAGAISAVEPGLGLHGGEDHSGHGGDGGGTTGNDAGGAGTAAYLALGAGYQFVGGWNVGLDLALGFDGGVKPGDPQLSAGRTFEADQIWSLTAAASLPTSEASRNTYKITTLSVGGGPTFPLGRWALSVSGSVAASWYKKTVIVDDAPASAGMRPVDGDLGSRPLHGDDEPEVGGDDDAVDGGTVGTGNREFDRVSLGATIGRSLWRRLRFDTGAGLSVVKLQFGKPFLALDLTIAQVSYQFGP